jgi:subtilisin family serine protease
MPFFPIKKFFFVFLTTLISITGLDVSHAAETASQKEKYIVRFMDDDDAERESDDYKKKGMKVERTLSKAFKGVIGEFSASEVSEIKRNPRVLYVEKDGKVQTTAFYSTPVTVNPVPSWGLDRVNQRNLPLDNRYSFQYDGQGVKAYVVDTGINSTHAQFAGRVLPGNSQIADGRGTEDCNGHGTHVAGTIGGSTVGIARNISIVPVRVLDCLGSGSFSGVIAGIDWIIADHQPGEPAVANLSLGGGLSAAVNDAIARLIADGVVVVVAAGNNNRNACNYSPASAPNAITVGATESTDRRASYSNFGTCLDIFAPGSAILSSWIGSTTATSSISGTSMASPHVAGTVALLLEKTPTATPAQIRTSLISGATPAKVTSAGSGSVNLLLATETASFVPTPVEQATLNITNQPLNGVVGTAINLTTSGGSGSGALTFSVTGTGCSITATNVLNATVVTNCVVTANKAASTGFLSATSSPVTFSFSAAPTATVPATPSVRSISSPQRRNLAVSVSTSNNGGSTLQRYVLSIWRSTTVNGALVLDRTVTINSTALTASTTITGLTSRTFYAVTAVAVNSVGSSAASPVSARVQVR